MKLGSSLGRVTGWSTEVRGWGLATSWSREMETGTLVVVKSQSNPTSIN